MSILVILYTVITIPTALHLAWIYFIQMDGTIPYRHHIGNTMARITAEICLISHDPTQFAIFAWVLFDLWVFYANVVGLRKQNMAPSSSGLGQRIFNPQMLGSIPAGAAKRVRCNGSTSACQAERLSSTLSTRTSK